MNVTFRDDVQGFVSKWDEFFYLCMRRVTETFSESRNHTRVRESAQLKTTFALDNQDTVHKGEPERYARLKSVVKMYLDQKTMDRNCDASNDKPASGASIRRKGDDKSEREDRRQGNCNQWLVKGHCSKRYSCSFQHESCKNCKSKKTIVIDRFS